MKKWNKLGNNKGYSLVELIIVIAILAILASVIALSVIRYIERGRESTDVYNASLIKDAINIYPFPSDFQGTAVTYTDPNTKVTETYTRGWVYVDRDEIRCSDQSTALALINAGLVHVSEETADKLAENEESRNRWFPTPPDGDYIRKTGINEYVFKNSLTVHARRRWNTYQIDVYVDDAGEVHLGASAGNTTRVGGHAKDEATAKMFADKLGLYDSLATPLGEQHSR